ncbi:O-antigen ligase family protein [Rubripirellula reticaptiva]|uniref:O-Antigen ligase n=1 Tax=Rubripirellula reticaptiva TaxID=2528013 RepID=A0A5C6F2V8_9BACT|nr:O-antigen ligase family protein [Rubripirellula reticaptiva]TWU55475.1 O-Antigen ligase [Rubripirellula reticaptiva]
MRLTKSLRRLKSMVSRLGGPELSGWAATGLACLMIALPAVVVWDYGGVLPWSQMMVCWAVVVITVLAFPLFFIRGRSYHRIQLAMPLLALAVVALGLFQSLPIPANISSRLAPGTHAAYRDWVPDQIRTEAGLIEARLIEAGQIEDAAAQSKTLDRLNVDDFGIDRHPTTLSQVNTLRAMIPFALSAVMMFIAVFAVRDRRALKLVLVIAAVSGTSVTLWGLLGVSSPAPPPSAGAWAVPVSAVRPSSFGPFVNRNNAGGFLNLTLAATVGLLVWTVRKSSKKSIIDPQYVLPPSNALERVAGALQSMVRDLDGPSILALFAAVVQVVGIAASQSRGALVAAAAGGVIVTLQLVRRQRAINPAMVAAVVFVLIAARWALVYLGLDGAVGERVDSIFTLSEGSQVGRLELVADGLRSAMHYLPLGSGLGTYQFATLPYQQASAGTSATLNADSMPVEWLVEGGAVIFVIIAIAIVVMFKGLAMMALHRRSHLASLTAMGWFLLTSQVVACCFDFGILLPANYLTAAVLVGAFFGMLPLKGPESSKARTVGGMKSRIESAVAEPRTVVVPLSIAFVLIAVLWTVTKTSTDQANDSFANFEIKQWFQAQRIRGERLSSLPRITSDTSAGATSDPQRQFLASLYLLANQEMATEYSGVKTVVRSEAELLDASTQIELKNDPRINVRRLMSVGGDPANFDAKSDDSAFLVAGQDPAAIRDARQSAVLAMIHCPLHPFVRVPLIKTDFVQMAERTDASNAELTTKLLNDLVRLQSGNPRVIEQAIRLAYVFPGPESMGPMVERLLELKPERFNSVWPLIRDCESETMIEAMIPETLDSIFQVAENPRVPESIRGRMWAKAGRMLADPSLGGAGGGMRQDEVAYAMSRIAIADGRTSDAIDELENAVRLSPANLQYRNHLIRLLIAEQRTDEAIKHLKRAILQQPVDASLQKMLKQVTKQ